MMRKMMMCALTGIFFFGTGITAWAQAEGAVADNEFTAKAFRYLGASLGMAIAAGLAALGDSRAIAAACEGVARNPGASARLQTLMLIGVVFIETLVLFTFAMIYLVTLFNQSVT